VAPVATPAVPEQLPEVVEAPWSRLLQQCFQSRPSQNLRSRSQSRSPLPGNDDSADCVPAQPSPKRAPPRCRRPRTAAEPRNDWQQKANADLDAWAKSGID
jgi:hypothetical protein